MKKIMQLLAVALGLNSCTYDPYHTSVGASYSTGYGHGGRAFSTTTFVATGDPRWGYDPYCHSYFDYRRRAYYDPFLNGYYPVGYRPQVIHGRSHPHGWRPGSGYCRPPGKVRNVTIKNHHNRESAYRHSGHTHRGRPQGRHDAHQGDEGDRRSSRTHATPRIKDSQQQRSRIEMERNLASQGRYPRNSTGRYPVGYNTPVTGRQQEISGRGRTRATPPFNTNAQRQVRQLAPPDQARSPRERTRASRTNSNLGTRAQPAKSRNKGGYQRGGPQPDKE